MLNRESILFKKNIYLEINEVKMNLKILHGKERLRCYKELLVFHLGFISSFIISRRKLVSVHFRTLLKTASIHNLIEIA